MTLAHSVHADSHRLDQVTLVGPNDLRSLRAHILSTSLFNSFVDRTFYIAPDTDAVRAAADEARAGLPADAAAKIVFVTEDTLLSPSVCANKWIYQQLLKLSVDGLRDSHQLSEPFFFTDVDTICLSPTRVEDVQHQGRFVFYAASDNDEPTLATDFKTAPLDRKPRDPAYEDWHLGMTWSVLQLLDLERAPLLCAIDACVVWSQRVMRRLKRDIAIRFDMPWQEAIISQYVTFIMTYKKHFSRQKGFKGIVFTPRRLCSQSVGFDELYHSLRIGFSEWQLYTYYLSTLDSSPYYIGLLGPERHPLVAEYNCSRNDISLLRKVIDASRKGERTFPNFVYFYPGIDDAVRPLLLDHLEERLRTTTA